jgi:two-component system cell cycle response regulator
MDSPITILVVEDDNFAMRFLESQIEDMAYGMIHAENGQVAIDMLGTNADDIDVIIMDREMPVMDGLTAIHAIKENAKWRSIPIIMVTGADGTNEMDEGLAAGVFYYLTKPVQPEMLRSVLTAALREANKSKTLASELSRHRTSFDLIDTCKFKFSSLNEAEDLSVFVANCFADPARVVHGIGELFMNAVEHGNLNIGYDKKGELLDAQIWRAEIDRLQSNTDKYVEAVITRKPNGVYLVVTDMGQGFNWRRYLTIDPSRAGDANGRGIAQANTTSFDQLTYNETGNQAIAFVGFDEQLDW